MTAAPQLSAPEQPLGRLNEIEREIFTASENDIKRAVSALAERLLGDADLMLELLQPETLRRLCYERLRPLVSHTPRLVRVPQENNAAAKVAARAIGNLMAFELPGGKPLKDASKQDVLAAIDHFTRVANYARSNARWLDMVSSWLKRSDKTVGEQLTETQLRELKAKAEL